MTLGLENLVMLFGLAAIALPVVIHLLNRRRYDVVDWGAMQFLEISETTRRRLLIEELLLLALRMGMIAVLVLALAMPTTSGPLVAEMGLRPHRDVVLILDGSASMALDDGRNRSPDAQARDWARRFLEQLRPGDTVALIHARQQPVVVGEPSRDLDLVRDKLGQLPAPAGSCDWPRAVREAARLLRRGQHSVREIILLSDGQKQGWADSERLFQWQQLAAQLSQEAGTRLKLWAVHLNEQRREGAVPNYSLAPLRAGRGIAVAGQRLTFRTALLLSGLSRYEPPHRLRLLINGKDAAELTVPTVAGLERGQVPLSFTHRFTKPGIHLVSVVVEADPPADQRPPDYRLRDHLPADNRRDLVVEVVESLPVLLVDGDETLSPESPTFFLRKALASSTDPAQPAAVLAHTVPLPGFTADLLTRDLDPKRPGSRPRALVLADVPRLTLAQQQAVEQFLAGGGGVLLALGSRVERTAYNRDLFQQGRGWLPAQLDRIDGDRDRLELAAAPDLKQLHLPALDLFRTEPNCTLGKARFPRWWKVKVGPGQAIPVALLTTGDPLLVEQPQGQGRVLLCTVPLDRSWDSTLPRTWEFPVLVHELLYHLADARAGDFHLAPGQPFRHRFDRRVSAPAEVELLTPGGEKKILKVENGQVHYGQTADAGAYRLSWSGAEPLWFVVDTDPREGDVQLATSAERKKVADLFPRQPDAGGELQPVLQYQNDVNAVVRSVLNPDEKQYVWWLLLLGVIGLLCGEIWMTRRMVASRGW